MFFCWHLLFYSLPRDTIDSIMVDSIRPIVASVVGRATDTKWGQVLHTPHGYGAVEIHSADSIARTKGIQLLTKLTRIFDTPPISLAALIDIADTLMHEDVASLVLLVPVGLTLYLVSRGGGRVYLRRNSKLAKLLEGNGALSGSVQPGDTVIAATEGFTSSLGDKEIISAFDHLSPQEVAEKCTMKLHEHERGMGGAALIFEVRSEDMPVTASADASLKDVIDRTPKSSKTIFIAGAKSFGRKVTTPQVRVRIRHAVHRLRVNPLFSSKHLIMYVVFSLFVVSVALGIRRQYTSRAQGAMSDAIVQAQHSFDEGMALLDLNPVKGRERLTLARDMLSPIVSKKSRSMEAKQAKDLYAEVVRNLTRAMHITNVTPELYFDMGLIKKDAKATDISVFEHTIGILDAYGKTVYSLGTETKNGAIVGGGAQFDGLVHIAAYGDKLYVWTPKGINQIRLSDQKTVPNVIPASLEWGTITDMAVFGGNIYLLDTQKSRIWKYLVTDKGFSEMFEYLNPDTLPDLSMATNMAIDGSVWLGSTNGMIVRFTSGKEDDYHPQGVDVPLGKRLTVFTHDETKMVYVLDHDYTRIVVFDKDGLYMAQYVWEEGFYPTSFVVSESSSKLFLLAEGKIYSVDLK